MIEKKDDECHTLRKLTIDVAVIKQTILSNREAVQVALATAEKALDKAAMASEKRFDAVNEFRSQQQDLIASFARMDIVEAKFESFDKRLALLQESVTAFHSTYGGSSSAYKQGLTWVIAAVGAVGTIIGGILSYLLKGAH